MLLAQEDIPIETPEIIPLETAILTIEPPPAENINCNFYNPVWVRKVGEVRYLENVLIAGGQGAEFQFASSTCSMPACSTASTTAGFTSGEIVSTVLLFLILMVLGFSLFLKMLYPKK